MSHHSFIIWSMSKANKECPVDGCLKLTNGCGLCHMHYWRLRHHGDVHHVKPSIHKRCSIQGCNKPSRRHGWCEKHYGRWFVHGDPNVVLLPQEKHGMTKSPEYQSWRGMKDRCYGPTITSHRFYSKKGVQVCMRWRRSFLAFYSDMGQRPEGMTLDRKDNDGNYSC